MFFFCVAFYSSIDPVKGRGLDEKKHTVAYLLPLEIKNFTLSYLISLSLSHVLTQWHTHTFTNSRG